MTLYVCKGSTNVSARGRRNVTQTPQVLEMFGADIGLTTNHVLKIMSEADENDDGVICYQEFLPVATEIIQVHTVLGERV